MRTSKRQESVSVLFIEMSVLQRESFYEFLSLSDQLHCLIERHVSVLCPYGKVRLYSFSVRGPKRNIAENISGKVQPHLPTMV